MGLPLLVDEPAMLFRTQVHGDSSRAEQHRDDCVGQPAGVWMSCRFTAGSSEARRVTHRAAHRSGGEAVVQAVFWALGA